MKARTLVVNASPVFSRRQSGFRTLMAVALIATVIACCPVQTRADIIALRFNATSAGGITNVTVGWAFSVTRPLLLTKLGVVEPFGQITRESHPVTLWDETGIIEAKAAVSAGTDYVTLSSPLLLAPGSYIIGAFYNSVADSFIFRANAVSTAPVITYTGGRFAFGNAFPSSDQNNNPNSYFGPNFQFTIPPSVPDASSSWTLLLLGLTATFALKHLHRRA
jgi:hypothetical protein